jgi:hypothetical protein
MPQAGFRWQLAISSMKPGKIDSDKTNDCAQALWGELIGIDDRTGRERTFTVYKRGGSLLIVSDTGCERLAGPDQGLSKTRIFQEVMNQFSVHAVRRTSSLDVLPG